MSLYVCSLKRKRFRAMYSCYCKPDITHECMRVYIHTNNFMIVLHASRYDTNVSRRPITPCDYFTFLWLPNFLDNTDFSVTILFLLLRLFMFVHLYTQTEYNATFPIYFYSRDFIFLYIHYIFILFYLIFIIFLEAICLFFNFSILPTVLYIVENPRFRNTLLQEH